MNKKNNKSNNNNKSTNKAQWYSTIFASAEPNTFKKKKYLKVVQTVFYIANETWLPQSSHLSVWCTVQTVRTVWRLL